MRHNLIPFRCYYQKIRRRKRKEEEKRGRTGERGRGRRRDGEMWRHKSLFHAEKGDGATAMESAWRRPKTIKTEARDSTASK